MLSYIMDNQGIPYSQLAKIFIVPTEGLEFAELSRMDKKRISNLERYINMKILYDPQLEDEITRKAAIKLMKSRVHESILLVFTYNSNKSSDENYNKNFRELVLKLTEKYEGEFYFAVGGDVSEKKTDSLRKLDPTDVVYANELVDACLDALFLYKDKNI